MAAQREAPDQAQGGGSALGEGLCTLMLQSVLACNQSPGIKGSSLGNAAGGQGLPGLWGGGWEAENSQTALSTLGFILSAWEPLVAFVCLLSWFPILTIIKHTIHWH